MAGEEKSGGLPFGLDASKVNVYGVEKERLEELQKAQQEAIEALKQRYAQPNWFKVAAGFAKPQLGGFLASLGSASEALGENIEQQRAQEIPIAQMKIQLAQTNMLLGQKQKAARIIERAQAENRQLTPKELEDVSNLDPTRGQQIMQSQEARAKTVANNIAITKQTYEAQGLPLPPLNEMGLPDTGKFPTGAGPQPNAPAGAERTLPGGAPSGAAPAAPAETKPAETKPAEPKSIYILPSGARANEDVYGLHKQGISIISNIRTPEEQAELRDHKDEKGNWLTKEGRPVAELSKHLTGDAIDLDPSKKLTEGQLKTLKDAGWKQSDPTKDPNHWERDVKKAEEPAKPAQREVLKSNWSQQSVTNPYTNVKEGVAGTQKALNSEGEDYRKSLAALGDQAKHSQFMLPIRNLEAEARDPRFDRVMGILSGRGLLSGLAELVQRGVNISAGDFHTSLSVPLSRIALAIKDDSERAFAEEVYRNLAQMALNNQKLAGVSPSTARNAELGILSEASAHPETLPAAAKFYIRNSHLNQLMHHDLYNDHTRLLQGNHQQYMLDPNSPVPMWDAKQAKSQKAIVDAYTAAIEKERQAFLEQTRRK